jgi:hypothetical protein
MCRRCPEGPPCACNHPNKATWQAGTNSRWPQAAWVACVAKAFAGALGDHSDTGPQGLGPATCKHTVLTVKVLLASMLALLLRLQQPLTCLGMWGQTCTLHCEGASSRHHASEHMLHSGASTATWGM